jgi:hypothetical protein
MAMARRESVTVSIAADTIGIFREIVRVRHVRVSACAGSTDDLPGKSSTSSNVSPSRIAPSFIDAPVLVKSAVNNKAQQGSLGCREDSFVAKDVHYGIHDFRLNGDRNQGAQ